MGFVYSLCSTGSHKNVLVVSGHADHFMRHDLPEREDQIVRTFCERPRHLDRDGIVNLSLGNVADERGRHVPKLR